MTMNNSCCFKTLGRATACRTNHGFKSRWETVQCRSGCRNTCRREITQEQVSEQMQEQIKSEQALERTQEQVGSVLRVGGDDGQAAQNGMLRCATHGEQLTRLRLPHSRNVMPGCTTRERWTMGVREAGNQEPGTRMRSDTSQNATGDTRSTRARQIWLEKELEEKGRGWMKAKKEVEVYVVLRRKMLEVERSGVR